MIFLLLTLKTRSHSAVTSMDASHLYSRRPGHKDSFSMSDYQWGAREKFECLGQTAVTLRCRRPCPFGRMIITGRPRRTCLSAIRLRGFSVRYRLGPTRNEDRRANLVAVRTPACRRSLRGSKRRSWGTTGSSGAGCIHKMSSPILRHNGKVLWRVVLAFSRGGRCCLHRLPPTSSICDNRSAGSS